MKLRLVVTSLFALACVSVIAAGDSYSMTYQATAVTRPTTIQILSFAIARQVGGGPAGPGATKKTPPAGPVTSGQIKLSLGRDAASLGQTFKKGAQFSKITIVLNGATPAGATAPMKHWVLSQATVDSYLVQQGSMAQATINLEWKTITVTSP